MELEVTDETSVSIDGEFDIVDARQQGRTLAQALGFSSTECTLIATAISEIARNIVQYAERGEMHLMAIQSKGRQGIQIIARDEGPGIEDVDTALRDGFSTGGSLGMGLPGARRLMDKLEIESRPGEGTTVTLVKWVP